MLFRKGTLYFAAAKCARNQPAYPTCIDALVEIVERRACRSRAYTLFAGISPARLPATLHKFPTILFI